MSHGWGISVALHYLYVDIVHSSDWFDTGGAAGAVSRITGALGKGIATLTLDDAYQKQRREALNRRPADFKEGFARGGKGLVMVCIIIGHTF